jgi:hypothetical protein
MKKPEVQQQMAQMEAMVGVGEGGGWERGSVA